MDDRPRNPDQIMGNPASFDLNRRIEQWRANLATSPSFHGENLDELESHLRDSVATMQSRGLSADEAFLIATRRIGTSSALESEFAKVNGKALWFDRCLWILIAVQLWKLISYVSAFTTAGAAVTAMAINGLLPGLGVQRISDGSIQVGVSLLASPLALAILVALGWRFWAGPRERLRAVSRILLQRPSTLALALFSACLVLSAGASWALVHWLFPILYHQNVPSRNFAYLFVQLPQCVILGALTFFVARRRLRLSRA